MLVMDQPPTISSTQRGAVDMKRLLRPKGSSYSRLTSSTCVLLKSEIARSSRKLWTSVGVREKLDVLKPPPVLAPVGSTDMSSMDLLNVYESPKVKPCSKRRCTAMNMPWYVESPDRKSTRLNS